MDTADRHKRLFLVRAAPGSPKAAAALAAVSSALTEKPSGVTVFFHGPGVYHSASELGAEWASLVDSGHLRLEVCSAAWRRRCAAQLPSPFEPSSLVQFWRQALVSESVTCFGGADEG